MIVIKCSLCEQTFDENDPLLPHRKSAHENHHDPNTPSGSRNQTWGIVEWIKV